MTVAGLSPFVAIDAGSLTLLSDDRFVHDTVDHGPGSPIPPTDTLWTPAVPFGPFSAGTLGHQTSDMLLSHGAGGDDSLSGLLDAEEKIFGFSSHVRLSGPSGTIYEKFPDFDLDTQQQVTTPFS